MSAVLKPSSSYQQLLDLPENLTGELIEGVLHTAPRPAAPHVFVNSILAIDIGSAYQRGRGGPGGWWILVEPEIHFRRDQEVVVPDLAGWRRERMPVLPKDQRFEIVPDWVCEILSPSSHQRDRVLKKKLYARYGVAYLWLVDPEAKILEASAGVDGQWQELGLYQDQDPVCVAPFGEITLALGDLWEGMGEVNPAA